jgi:predicted nucleic acid-binding protein
MPTATERILEVTQATVNGKPKIALDTNCVRYYLEDTKPWSDLLDPIFQAGISGTVDLYISTVVVAELLTFLIQKPRNEAGYDAELFLTSLINRHFAVLDVNETVARAAGRLRGTESKLATPDALIGATSLTNGHTLFITNDAQLADALPDSNCICLREGALEWLARSFPGLCFDGCAPVICSKKGKGLPTNISTASLELGGVQPGPSVKWKRILKDAQTVASAVNESFVFFVLGEKNGRRMETREVLFCHEGLTESRPPKKVIKRLQDHLGYSGRTGAATNVGSHIHGLVFASLAREKARQNNPGFTSKSDHQKDSDAWNAYLALWQTYRSCLNLPRTTWLLCEDGAARVLDVSATIRFLDQARNVLGWKDER